MHSGYENVLGNESILDGDNWAVLRTFLPRGWDEAAYKTGAVNRIRGLSSPDTLLRILLLHLANGCSLAETAARAQQAGWADITAVTVFHRLQASEEWLRWLAEHQRLSPELPLTGARRVRAVDATVIAKPGKSGADWRIHYAIDLHNLQCDFFQLTDIQGGETWRRFPIDAGDIVVGDRVYSQPAGIAHVVKQGGDVVVRYRWRSLPLFTEAGKRLAIWSALRRLRVGQPREWSVWLQPKTGPRIAGRLIAVKRSASATRLVRKRLRQKAIKKQEHLSENSLRAAEYFQLWTTLPADWTAAEVLRLYRARWQIELAFKRMKSLMGVGHLPKSDPHSGRAWLHGKLFVSLLAEAMIAAAETFSPWGYPLPAAAQSVARDRVSAS